jgi:hypothetical protein
LLQRISKSLITLKRWALFVVTPNIYPKRWQDRLFRGHVNIGPITIFGANAMHWAVNIQFRGTYLCFHPRTRTHGAVWPAYFYISPNATPWAATFKLGKKGIYA